MDPETSGIPVLAFNEGTVPREHAFDVYHDTTAPLFDTNPLRGGDGFRADTVDYLVDDLVVARLDTGPHTLRRSAGQLRDGTSDWVTVQVHHSGGLRGSAGRDANLHLDPGRIGIVDFAEPFSAWSPGGVATWVALPRDRVEHADRLAPASTLDRRSVRDRVLRAAIADLWRRLADARADQAEALAAGIVDTVNTVLDPDGFAPSDHDLRVAMEDHLRANLGDLDIGVDDLRAAFHCSRSSVYRCFEEQGGVLNYIREQRLLRCFEELTRPVKLPRRISDVATRWGFENPSHFNRLFKAQFGLPPSALPAARGGLDGSAGPTSAAAAEQITAFHSWASRLER